jgi:PAS domain S-box-containing protein
LLVIRNLFLDDEITFQLKMKRGHGAVYSLRCKRSPLSRNALPRIELSRNELPRIELPVNSKNILLVQENISCSKVATQLTGPFLAHRFVAVDTLEKALSILPEFNWDVLLLELSVLDSTALKAIELIRAVSRDISLIVITDHNDSELAIECLKNGADDLINKSRMTGELLVRSVRYVEAKIQSEKIFRSALGFQTAIVDFGLQALKAQQILPLWEKAVAEVQEKLGVRYCRVLKFLPDEGRCIFETGSGWNSEMSSNFSIPVSSDNVVGWTLESKGSVMIPDFRRQTRFSPDAMLVSHGLISSLSVCANGFESPYGILSIHTDKPRSYSFEESQFLQAVANTIGLVTQRIQMEQALLHEYQRFHGLFAGSLDGIVIANNEMQYMDANLAACQIFGVKHEELLKKKVTDFVDPDDLTSTLDIWDDFHKKRFQKGTFRLKRPDGEIRFVEYAATFDFMPNLHLSSLRDMTERLKIEEERDRFFNVALDMMCIASFDGYLKRMNPACEKILGYTPAEMCAAPISQFLHPDDIEPTGKMLASLICGKHLEGFENRYRCKNGQYKTLSWSTVTVGQVIYATARDITERNQLQAQLLQADRMVAVGMLAAGVAHEINNPLGYVMANLNLMLEKIDDSRTQENPEIISQLQEMAVDASAGAERVRQVVRGLKLFSRSDGETAGPVDLQIVLESSIKMARHEIESRAQLVTQYGATPKVHGNEGKLGQVFLNLLINATQAIPEGDADQQRIAVTTGTDSQGRGFAEITDTGVGIPKEVKSRIRRPNNRWRQRKNQIKKLGSALIKK